ncbi:MAG: CHASE2 domain-containing protein [Candidatus Xenobiia bacterium LiM19]
MKVKVTRKSVFTRGEILLSIVITVLFVLFLSRQIILNTLDHKHLDSLYKERNNRTYFLDYFKQFSDNLPILFIPIDDESIEQLNLNWPLPRTIYADLIENIARYKPRAIGIDLLFTEKSPNETNDKKLAQALKKHDVVILGRTIDKNENDGSLTMMDPASILLAGWTPEMKQKRIGYVDSGVTDSDGVIRKVRLLRSHNRSTFYSFDVLLLTRYLSIPLSEVRDCSSEGYQQIGDIMVPVDSDEMWINYYNSLDKEIRTMYNKQSLKEIQDGFKSKNDKILKEMISNNIVIIGVTATQAFERQKSPLGETSGPEIHNNILLTLLSRKFLKSPPFLYKYLILLVPCLVLVIILPFLSPLAGFIIYLLGNMTILFISNWIFNTYGIIPYPVTGWILLFLTYALITVAYFIKTHRAKNRLKSLLLELAPVPEPVLERIMERFQGKVAMGGEKVELSILFSDIRGYTSLSQNLDPREVMNTLNEFYSAMGSIYKRNGGMLFDYMGDGQMVVFGADSPADDRHAFMAVKSAIEMCQELTSLNEAWNSKNRRSVDIGIGINTGEVSLGFLGSGQSGGRKQFAAIGDTTNVASRIEGLTKQFAANILISESTFEKSQGLIEVEPLPPTKVKGKDEPVKIYKVTGFKKSNE